MKIKKFLIDNIYIAILTIIVILFFAVNFYKSLEKVDYPPPAKCQIFGLYIGQQLDNEALKNLESTYAKRPTQILSFVGWSDYPFEYNMKELRKMVKSAYSPVITLEPWYYPSKKPVKLENIVSGYEDEVIRAFSNVIQELEALSLETTNVDIYVRFAHEMNGYWYPWSGINNNMSGELYKKAYKKVYETVSANTQSPNVKFIWSINSNSVPNRSWNRAKNYYPGDTYVDVIGIDGYNWGDRPGWFTRWRSFDRIFDRQLGDLIKLRKPIYITEMASAGSGKDKAEWIRDFFDKLEGKYAFIESFIWFDIDKEKDWRIMSDDISVAAFNEGLNRINICSGRGE